MGFLYGLRIRLMTLMVIYLIVVMFPGLPPHTTFNFKEFTLKRPSKALKGALESNQYLDDAQRLLDGRVYGPECLIERNDEIYMGIHGGEVIKLRGEHVTHVTKIGQPCEEIFEESRCGRPLGLAFDTQGNNLIVADAYYGIWLVNLNTGKKQLLISPEQELPGASINRKAKIFNSVAVAKNGDIYWTDSSSDFGIEDLVFTMFANPSGRLFKYNRATNTSEVLLDELFFANGVALSPQEDFVVVVETGAVRLLKYYLKGEKKGQTEVFVDGLPGHPDNLTPDADGLWVPLIIAADENHPSLMYIFTEFPNVRMFLSRVLYIFETPFRYLNKIYPNKLAQRFVHFIGNAESVLSLSTKRATVVRVDWSGSIVGSLHGSDHSVGFVSHVLEHKNQLYLGSPYNRYLARVKSPKPTHTVKLKNVKSEGIMMEPVLQQPNTASTTTATTTTTTRKPTTTTTTTTTPKPTTTTTTTTPKPTTTTTTTTTPRPTTTTTKATTTTTSTTTTTTTPKPTTTATPKVKPTTSPPPAAPPKPQAPTKRVPPKEPAPVEENIVSDVKPPKPEKLKIINKQGEHVEL